MEGPDGRLSESAVRLVGGLCHYADSLTAFGNTVASSYLRLVPHQEAPTKIFWSGLNRSALIRVPLAWSEVKNIARIVNPQEQSDYTQPMNSKTVELRSADGSALIHLLLAGVAMAGEWGFSNRDTLEQANKLYLTGRDSSERGVLNQFASLPADCRESAGILKQKRGLYERDNIFPAEMIDYIVGLLEKEHADVRGITDPDELRRIMHRDLHKH
jgi:glutamine synthetase